MKPQPIETEDSKKEAEVINGKQYIFRSNKNRATCSNRIEENSRW